MRSRFLQWARDKTQSLSPEQTWLLWLAVMTYLVSGLYLCLFTQGIDFHLVYYTAKKIAAGHGALIYDRFLAFTPGQSSLFYMYPPLVAALYVPLTAVSAMSALLIFHVLSHAALWVALVVWVRRWCNRPEHALRVIVAVLLFYPLYYGLHLGQSELLLLACLMVGWEAHRRGWWWLAGFLFAIAITFKLFLAFLLLHWLITKQWKLLLASVLCLLVMTGAGVFIVGVPVWMQWVAKLSGPLGIEAFIDNQSITGFVCRTFPFLSPTIVIALRAVMSLVLVGGYVWTVWRQQKRQPPEMLLSFAILTLLLVSPHTDTHHLTFLLIPFVTLIVFDRMDFSGYAFYAFFACFVPLIAFHFVWDERAQALVQGASVVLVSIPFFILLAFWENWRRRLVRGH